ncbi:hypothetical protein WL93_26430 [Burkholderia diffusa]|nr:hypothetical protein WI26_15215 [Burkholderia diffusa]KWF77912.1 hypothetical protein WL93_26430 [Burkholderia diffusa]
MARRKAGTPCASVATNFAGRAVAEQLARCTASTTRLSATNAASCAAGERMSRTNDARTDHEAGAGTGTLRAAYHGSE